MGLNSLIDWTKHSAGLWEGCHATTNPGCKECYAVMRNLPKFGRDPHTLRRTSDDLWRKPLAWQARLEQTGQVETVFACPQSDFFHPHADNWREDAWALIKSTPNLQWIILTQRVEGVLSRLPADWREGYANVWLGVSASDQAHADKRIPKLLAIPAALHLVSLEPLIEAVFLRPAWLQKLGWVITGGMSGSNWEQYPLYPAWVKTLRDQCVGSGVSFFFKQLGGPADDYRDGDQAILDNQLWKQIPAFTAASLKCQVQLTLF